MKMHIIGIGGNGMSGVARLAWQAGHYVTGSDIRPVLHEAIGVPVNSFPIFAEHHRSHVAGAKVVVASSGVPEGNCELAEARMQGLPVWSRLEAVERLLSNKRILIAVAGSFGKSSTVAMLSHILSNAGFNPTVYLGAPLPGAGGNANLTKSQVAIVEACEYKNEFLKLHPTHILVTNIAINHEDFFGSGLQAVAGSFAQFAGAARPKLQRIYYCKQDEGTKLSGIGKHPASISFGSADADWSASINGISDEGVWQYELAERGRPFAVLETRWAGEHTARNLAGIVALCSDLGVPREVIANAMRSCPTLSRRFVVTPWAGGLFVDDNARQPQQLAATVATIRAWRPNSRLVVALGHWGKLNPRDCAAYVDALRPTDVVLVPPSTAFELQSGGPEKPGADHAFVAALRQSGTDAILGPLRSFDPFTFVATRQVVFATIGFDSFIGDFSHLKSKALERARPSD